MARLMRSLSGLRARSNLNPRLRLPSLRMSGEHSKDEDAEQELPTPHASCNNSEVSPHSAEEDAELQKALAASAELYESVEQKKSASRKRLQEVISQHDARVTPIEEDGNCQFRALSMTLYGTQHHHQQIRAQVVERMRARRHLYENFVQEPYLGYLERMAQDGEWGDSVTLQAASDMLERSVRVFTDVPGGEHIMVSPTWPSYRCWPLGHSVGPVGETLRSLLPPLSLAFTTELHYDAAFMSSTESQAQ